MTERVEAIRQDAKRLAVTCDHTWGEVRGKGACAECVTRFVTIALAQAEERRSHFEDLAAERTRLLAQAERERGRWQNDWCDQCDKPQWILPDGEHDCKTYTEVRAEVERLTKYVAQFDVDEQGVTLRTRLAEAEVERLKQALAEIVESCAHPEFDDARIDYISVQVSREALTEARAALEGRSSE